MQPFATRKSLAAYGLNTVGDCNINEIVAIGKRICADGFEVVRKVKVSKCFASGECAAAYARQATHKSDHR